MAQLVERDNAQLPLGVHTGLALRPHQNPVARLIELGHADPCLVAPRRKDSSLVHDVHDIGAGKAGRQFRQRLDVYIVFQRLAPEVYAEDRLSAPHVRRIDDYAAVEAARPKQGGIKHVWAVSRSNHDHAGVRVEAVHLDQ